MLRGNISNGTNSSGGTVNSIVKSGPGLLWLTGINTYTGSTTINAGGVFFGQAASIGGGGVILGSSGTCVVAVGFPINNSFLGQVSAPSGGVIALAADSSNNLDFSSPGMINVYLARSAPPTTAARSLRRWTVPTNWAADLGPPP